MPKDDVLNELSDTENSPKIATILEIHKIVWSFSGMVFERSSFLKPLLTKNLSTYNGTGKMAIRNYVVTKLCPDHATQISPEVTVAINKRKVKNS